MRPVLRKAYDVLSSLGLSVTVLAFLLLLTVIGTLEQADTSLYEVQKRYFESAFVVHRVGGVPVPLPGVSLLLVVLAVNLVLGGIVRLRKGRATWGVLLTHVGILVMMAGSATEALLSEKGHATIAEGSETAEFQSHYDWEIAVAEIAEEAGPVTEHVIPGERFARLQSGSTASFRSPAFPFDLTVRRFLPHCEPRAASGPRTVDGVELVSLARGTDAERDTAGAYVAVIPFDGSARIDGVLWSRQRFPMSVTIGGRRFAIDLSHRRWQMPFSVQLEDFRRELHPGTGMPKAFESDVVKVQDGVPQRARISMNQPLRQSGYTLYQSGFIEPSEGGGTWWSTFSVVRNPADAVPLWSCVIVTAGLLLHFSQKLLRHVRTRSQRSAS